jgi:PP-loop superfamily ATP-utilizing enzyme
VRYGLEITPGRLRQVEEGEAYLRSQGVVGDLRVRHHGTHATVEVAPAEMGLLRSRWQGVERFFAGLGFERVELDPSGYRRGGLLTLAPQGGA